MKLHLGVYDFPYATPPSGPKQKNPSSTTTGDVALILEARYHVMENFFGREESAIQGFLEKGFENAMVEIIAGNPNASPYPSIATKIDAQFKHFLSQGIIEQMGIPGVPTKAALARKSSRFKKGKNPQGPRPSFIDTGLYESSFVSWFDD